MIRHSFNLSQVPVSCILRSTVLYRTALSVVPMHEHRVDASMLLVEVRQQPLSDPARNVPL